MIDNNKTIREIEKVLNGESNFVVKSKEQFNRCIDHIYQLICDAYTLYCSKAFSSSVFLSVAIIEEVAKVHMGMYITHSNEYTRKDKLRDHKTKEIIGASYTISMGQRIKAAIDLDKLERIYEMFYSGELKNLRENAIYCGYQNEKVVIPKDIIDKEFSRNILLFAIESFDDNLVGYTEYSMQVSEKTDIFFYNIAAT